MRNISTKLTVLTTCLLFAIMQVTAAETLDETLVIDYCEDQYEVMAEYDYSAEETISEEEVTDIVAEENMLDNYMLGGSDESLKVNPLRRLIASITHNSRARKMEYNNILACYI